MIDEADIDRLEHVIVGAVRMATDPLIERITKLEQRSVDLETKLEARPGSMIYRGVYEGGKRYDRGDTVTCHGSLWIAMATTSAQPGDGETPWRLSCKRGRDGKDTRPEGRPHER
jgi:hypothetical protein